MSSSVRRTGVHSDRRRFLRDTLALAGGLLAFPTVVSASTLGRGGAVPPNERIVLGGVGVGRRGSSVLSVMLREPVVQFVADADPQRARRESVKQMADDFYGNQGCVLYDDFREVLGREDIDAVLIATGDRWHAMAAILSAKAGKDMYCEKPFSLTIQESLDIAATVRRYARVFQAGTQRRSVGNFVFATRLARTGKLGKLHTVHANTRPPATTHDWLPEEPLPPKEECDWDAWLGPTPWRPFNRQYVEGRWRGHYDFHGGGILEWGSHTIDQCQWANGADSTVPVEYQPTEDGCIARYANGVKLVMRPDGWLGLGTCSVRYEGDEGWVETGDGGELRTEPESLRAGRKISGESVGLPANHIRNWLECVKTRGQPAANADVACQSHIASHAAYIAWQLKRTLRYDPAKNEFLNDDEANRMRSRALREPFHV